MHNGAQVRAQSHIVEKLCGEKLHYQSHMHIDVYTKDLVKQLRQNNVSLGKVYSIIGSFFLARQKMFHLQRGLLSIFLVN